MTKLIKMFGLSTAMSANLVAVALGVYLGCICLYRLFFHPLAKFPGPKLAAVSRWYEAYYDVLQGGRYTFKIAELHETYGPIVRISPYELHINDPDYYEKLYRQDGGRWDKYAWTYDAFGVPGASVGTVDHNIHRKRRGALNSFFSKLNIAGRQQIVTACVSKLRLRIIDAVQSKSPIDIGAAVSAMTTDISTGYVLGESYNNLDRLDFNQNMTDMLQGSGIVWRLTKHVRFFGPLMKSMPISWIEKSGDPKVVAFIAYLINSAAKVKQLVSSYPEEKEGEVPATLVGAILESNLPPAEKNLQRVNDEIDTVVGAGLETVAAVIRVIIYHLYSDPSLLARVRNDLRDAEKMLSDEDDLTLTQLEQIPSLTAIINEGLRLNPGIATRMARVAPDRELIYNDWVIPRATPVGMTTLLMHLNPVVYHNPRAFDPDRWMDPRQKIDASKYFAPFSKGTRICLGMHLAYAELYMTVAMLISNFDFELLGATVDDVEVYSDQFIAGTKTQNSIKAMATQINKKA